MILPEEKKIWNITYIAAAGIVAAVLYYQFFILPGEQRERVTQAENGQVVAEARNEVGKEIRKITESHYVERRILEERADDGMREVLQAADDAGASDAARRAACMFNHSYPSDHPTCKVQ